MLHYWGSDGFYRIYPTSVPLTEEMTRRGRTSDHPEAPRPGLAPDRGDAASAVPTCRPTCRRGRTTRSASARSTSAGPSYRIHGTNDIRKIGRQSSSGCIGLFNEHILEVYDRAQVGTPVLLI